MVRDRFRVRINNIWPGLAVGNNRGGHLGIPNSSFRGRLHEARIAYPADKS